MDKGTLVAQGRAWNYVPVSEMEKHNVLAIVAIKDNRVVTVNIPTNVHLRADGTTVTIRGRRPENTLTLDYRSGDGIVGVATPKGLFGLTLSNFAAFAPEGLVMLHTSALSLISMTSNR